MSTVLRLEALEVRLGGFTLGPIDLSVAQGEYLVIVGPSGAGKSVLLETMIGWHQPTRGRALLGRTEVRSIRAGKRGFSYVPQDIGLLPHLSVRENLLFPLDCRGVEPDPALLETLTATLNLGPLLDRRDPRSLSQGERQRVALGRALLTRPKKLFLDEPCAALDPHLRREFQLLLRDLHRRLGQSVVHVTHDREEAFLLGERIAVILGGRLCQVAPPDQLYARPADLAVARFLAPENLWPARVVEAGAASTLLRVEAFGYRLRVDHRPPAPVGEPCLVGIRPEEVMILHPDRPLRPQVQENVFGGVIEEILRLDGRVQVHVHTGEGLRAVSRLPICAAQDMGLSPGQQVRVCLKTRSLYTLAP
ncbi:MAG: ABC transporter ATP-binding protein [Acidobacteriota bacterium]|nr:ABC transporter ATP-binding protein [Acidobacteriota bacterium]MDQ7088351.1 ABC transporter ATP-binding protein [Acidobacteriota bacterium]